MEHLSKIRMSSVRGHKRVSARPMANGAEGAGRARLDGSRRRRIAGVTGRWWRTAVGSSAVGGTGEVIEAMREKNHLNRFELYAEA